MAPKVARVGTVSNCIGPRLNFHGVARQTQPRAQPTLGAVLQFDRSAMAFRDRLDQREAQARTASFGTARRFQPHKWFENARAAVFAARRHESLVSARCNSRPFQLAPPWAPFWRMASAPAASSIARVAFSPTTI